MLQSHTVLSEPDDAGIRLDKFLATHLPELSRSRLQDLIEQGYVTVDGKVLDDASAKVKAPRTYLVMIPEAAPSYMPAQAMALDIIFEDDHMLVINKPAGLTVHPGAGNPDMTLVNALLAHCGESLSGIGGVARPGIVHRIDKETSGLLVVAKHDTAHLALSEQLAKRTLKRTYLALIWGTLKQKSGTITGNIGRSISNRKKMAVLKSGGKPAMTHYKQLENFSVASLVECRLETGRTHQIRVHFAHIHHPLVGDPVYGQSTRSRLSALPPKALTPAQKAALLEFDRQALHATALELVHPVTGKTMRFECPLPADMHALIGALS
jgi:23S rRNA pseudouridine1911/1915/1917 synthase